jgi:NTP pyrophosphatase (non-canonical NTP hydrolase)
MKSLRDYQNEVTGWQKSNFPNNLPYMALLGVGEEVGELMHAHLKGEQGIRHTPLEIHHMKQDAVGDILIYLFNYCEDNNIDLQDAFEKTWSEVSKRNWNLNKLTGKAVNENVESSTTIELRNVSSIVDNANYGEGAILD